MLVLPLVGREIPVIADEYVDKEFGTGCVKITSCTTTLTTLKSVNVTTLHKLRL